MDCKTVSNYKLNWLWLSFRFLLYFLLITAAAYAQQQPEKVFSTQFDKDTYYIKLLPDKPIKALGVILPGLLDRPASPLAQSEIPAELLKNDIAVMIPVLSKNNEAFTLEDKAMDNLNTMLLDFKTRNNLAKDMPIIIGGMSIGGTVALKFYTENQADRLSNHLNNITNVFAIDPPLDMARLRSTFIKINDKTSLAVMDSSFSYAKKGNEKLKSISVYNPDRNGSLASFETTKLRLYSEPDINWWITERNQDLYDMNLLDISAYVNALHTNKQNKVELILTENKGYRFVGGGKTIRHPHSWSIADADEFIKWVLASI